MERKPAQSIRLAFERSMQPASGREHRIAVKRCSRHPAESIRLAFERSGAAGGQRSHRRIACRKDSATLAGPGILSQMAMPDDGKEAGTEHPPRFRAIRCSRHPAESIRLAFERSGAAGGQRSHRRIACRKDSATLAGPGILSQMAMPDDGKEAGTEHPPRFRAIRCSRHPAESIRLAFERSGAAGGQRSHRRIACRKDSATLAGPGILSQMAMPDDGKEAGTEHPPRFRAIRCSRHPAESIRLAFERSGAAGGQRSHRRIACRKDSATLAGPGILSGNA